VSFLKHKNRFLNVSFVTFQSLFAVCLGKTTPTAWKTVLMKHNGNAGNTCSNVTRKMLRLI